MYLSPLSDSKGVMSEPHSNVLHTHFYMTIILKTLASITKTFISISLILYIYIFPSIKNDSSSFILLDNQSLLPMQSRMTLLRKGCRCFHQAVYHDQRPNLQAKYEMQNYSGENSLLLIIGIKKDLFLGDK
ncbi:hypothetical protein DOE73_20410 [Paenibacillus dendritiformis]|nr:hypothetical protein DOE73_20410 [Paenibacillus dendritiformis]